MARLLILLACARVAAGVMDALDIKAVCEVPTDGGPRKIYLDMDAAAVDGRDNVRLRRDERRRVGRGVLRGRPGLLARHPVPRVLARPDVAARPRVLRVQLSTRDPGHHACP